jgi:small multidrug resistance family-3 protein
MLTLKSLGLFVVTAVAEVVGCYLPYLWIKRQGSPWLLLPAAACLALFVWLLTLHPAASGRTYAAYGGVYVGVAVIWLWLVNGIRPTSTDLVGAALMLAGTCVIVSGGWRQ